LLIAARIAKQLRDVELSSSSVQPETVDP
jgi:hypothetical protein